LSVTGSIEGYQETLIAGTNITITGNTISSAGSGGTLPANANFSSVNTSTLNTNTLNASTIDTSGDVSIGGIISAPNQVGFLAFSRSNATVSGTNTQKLPYNQIVYNIGGHYDPSTYVFTCPISGRYLCVVNYFNLVNQGATIDLIKKSGSTQLTILRNQGDISPDNNVQNSATIITYANVGDQIYGLMRYGALRLSPINYTNDSVYGPYSIHLIA